MTAQPSSQAEREDVAREVLAAECERDGLHAEAHLWRNGPAAKPLSHNDRLLRAMLAFSARENADDRAAYTYDVTWSRADGERLTCRDLSPRLVTARIIQAIKTSGPITIHAVEGRADDRAPALVEAAVAEEDCRAAAELVEWWDTGILRDGLVREEAAELLASGKSDEHSSVRRAEHEITSRIVRRAAIRALGTPSQEASNVG